MSLDEVFWRHHRRRHELRPVAFTMVGSSPAERVEPITLDNTKAQMRFLTTADDVLITAWIATARQWFENITARQCVTATYEYAMHRPPWRRLIELPRPPLRSIASIEYDDPDGNPQTFDASNYIVLPSMTADGIVDPYCRPGQVMLATGASWPTCSGLPRSFRINLVCGYGNTADDMPGILQAALYLFVTHFHRNRAEVFEAITRGGAQVLPMGADVILKEFKYSSQYDDSEHVRREFGWWPLNWWDDQWRS